MLDSITKVKKAMKAAEPFVEVEGLETELLSDAMHVVSLGITSDFVI